MQYFFSIIQASFRTPFLFNAVDHGDPVRICGKKLDSFGRQSPSWGRQWRFRDLPL